jgi:hypothetical protein
MVNLALMLALANGCPAASRAMAWYGMRAGTWADKAIAMQRKQDRIKKRMWKCFKRK